MYFLKFVLSGLLISLFHLTETGWGEHCFVMNPWDRVPRTVPDISSAKCSLPRGYVLLISLFKFEFL